MRYLTLFIICVLALGACGSKKSEHVHLDRFGFPRIRSNSRLIPAEFPYGGDSLQRWMDARLRVKKSNTKMKSALVEFFVESDGTITNAHIIESVDSVLDQRALDAVMSMPKWRPAQVDNIPVKTRYRLPIRFIKTKK